MKKHLLLFILLAVFTTGSFAQVRFGLKLSPNLSWTKPDSRDLDASGNIFGYSFGLITDFVVGSKENYAFSTGILLNNTGGKYTQSFTVTDTSNNSSTIYKLESRLKLRYIEVPLTLKLKTNEIGYMTYYGQIGIGTAFNIRSKADVENVEGGQIVKVEDVDLGDNTNLFKASLIVGGGIEYNITGETYLMAGITYNGGFTNTFDGVKDDDGNDVKVLQNYLELNLGVYF